MNTRFLAIPLSAFLLFSFCIGTSAQGFPAVSAKSAVTIEAESRETVFEKNARERLPMASTTKIMTALVVLERLPLDHTFVIDDSAVGTEGTNAYLEKGDTLTVEAALYALLLQSANDVANGLAIEAAGSIEDFCLLMNKKAAELGLSDTSFKNPSGLPADGHYTTAYDLAVLGTFCLENESFAKIVSAKSATVKINGKDRTFTNHNKLLSLYEDAIGVKTGFTKESGRCLVGAWEKDGVRLVTVTLSASSDWNDHIKMFEYGLKSYHSYTLCDEDFTVAIPAAGNGGYVLASPKETYKATLKKGADISVRIETEGILLPPLGSGEKIADAVFLTEQKEIARIPLYSLTGIG